MTDFEVNFDDAKAFAERLNRAPDVVESEVKKAIDRITLAGEAAAKKVVPVDTGNLRRSIATKPATFAGGEGRGVYGTAVPYAQYVEEGTSKMEAQPYMEPSLEAIRPKVEQEFDAMIKRIIAQVGE